MNQKEFRAWFIGFTEGKDSLNADDIEKIKEHLRLVEDEPIVYPQIYIPSITDCSEKCVNCEEHDYPTPWGGTVPPFCKKCGKQAPSMDITYMYNTTCAGH